MNVRFVSRLAVAILAWSQIVPASAEVTQKLVDDDMIPRSAHGTFVQKKTLSDVGVTLVSKGEFRFVKGVFFEWKVMSPAPSLFFATPTNWSFTVRGKTTTRDINVDVSSISNVFAIKEMKEYVERMTMVPEKGFPEKVEIFFKNGDRIEIELAQSR